MAASTLTHKGQTTIPKEIRDYLHLHPGDKLKFVIDSAGHVMLLAATIDVRELRGILPKPKASLSLEEIEKIIKKRGGHDRH